MGNYLPLLIIFLACPLMMVFMMRGMHGGHDMAAENKDPRRDGQAPVVDPRGDQRILDLERQVAELRAERDRHESDASRP
jgi:uncharacterized protein YceH (UPF0502 family)